MILIDSIYINDSGGKILLDYLIVMLEKKEIKVHYLLDSRVIHNHPEIINNKVTYLESGVLKRYAFYKENRDAFSKVLCFGNLPPFLKLNAEVFTYFHQSLFLKVSKEFSFAQKMQFRLKSRVLTSIKNNTDYWLVQSKIMKDGLELKYNLSSEKVKILPFYPPLEKDINFVRIKHTFLYVSGGYPHKNHIRLIDAFCRFYDTYHFGELILTVSSDFVSIISLINQKINNGYPITNLGFVKRDELYEVYRKAEFFIFPSLTESFGLGLIEAIECGCKVIGADLPYTYEVCEPSIVFNPLYEESFIEAFKNSLNEDVKISIPRIKNNINKLINILQENPCN